MDDPKSAGPTEGSNVLIVDLTHITPDTNKRYVLRLKNRVTSESRILKAQTGSQFEVSDVDLPGPMQQTVAWVDEIGANGSANTITPRVRLDTLKHVAQVERWMRQPTQPATRAEALATLETLMTWEYFGDSEWRNRITRIVNDVLRTLRRVRHIPANSRLSLLCQHFAERNTYSDSVPGNVMASLTAIAELHSVLERHGAATQKSVTHVSLDSSPSIPETLRNSLLNLIDTSVAFNLPGTSSRLHRGQVLSVLKGRTSALGEFRAALSSGRGLVKSMYLDMGSLTYGTPDINAGFSGVNVTWHGTEIPKKATGTILYSANVEFLRRYMTRILFYAAAEPDLHLHFHLVASESEASDFISEASELAQSIHGFSHRTSMPSTISWSSSLLPAGVGNPITYFACARYLVAEQVMDRFGSDVWIQDVDLYPTSPIFQAYKTLVEFDVALVASSGINVLAPWRRYMAGNVYISRSDNGRTFAYNAASYISSFLKETDSWMLDQNALDWAVEQSPADTSIVNMGTLNIQLTQSTMNGAIES